MAQQNGMVDEEFLKYLVDMHKAYDKKNLPYNEKVGLLTLIPSSWSMSSSEIINHFQCTEHAVRVARSLKRANTSPLHIEEQQ